MRYCLYQLGSQDKLKKKVQVILIATWSRLLNNLKSYPNADVHEVICPLNLNFTIIDVKNSKV